MRRTKTITVGEPPRDVTIREPTVAEMRNWLLEMDKLKTEQIDFVTHGLLNDASLTDIVLMSDLSLADLDGMVASEIREVLAACQELNPDFFMIRSRKMLMWQMEAHTAYAALRPDEQWMLANPGPSEAIPTSPA
jgi:hypothetical protein